MSNGLSERFEAKVDRSGVHHTWTGSKKADGTGKLKVDGKTVTAPRIAWGRLTGLSPPTQRSEVVPTSGAVCESSTCPSAGSRGSPVLPLVNWMRTVAFGSEAAASKSAAGRLRAAGKARTFECSWA
ncbi:MAG: hypothetical protein ACRD07_06410 [Acidimicrobiales bacterium]